jgi:hypothetical protein
LGKGLLKMYVITGREDQKLRNNHRRGKMSAVMERIFHRTKIFLQDIPDYFLSGSLDNEPDMYRISDCKRLRFG